MSMMSLLIVASVTDLATKPLKKIKDGTEDVGRAVKKTGVDMIQFNRVMFSTAAFLGFFQKQFQTLSSTIQKGADFGRLEDQFESVLGPKGVLFDAISGLTNASIDKMEAMRSGLALKTLGIARSTQDVAEIVVGAGVAAKRAGMDSTEGIKRITQALKDGNLSNLEFLNLIRTNDAGLKAHLSVLQKYTGVLGASVTAQQKHALILGIIRDISRSAKNETRDLADTWFDLGQSVEFLKATLGKFVGTALQPLMETTIKLVNGWTMAMEQFKKSKEILFLAKAFMVTTAAAASLFAVLYSGRMIISGLASLGLGVPRLIMAVVGLGGAFLGATHGVDGMMEKLKVFGALVKGVFELVDNFDPETGLSKLSNSTAQMLEKNGLLGFVKNLSRAIIVVKSFATEVGNTFMDVFHTIDRAVGGITKKIFSFLGMSSRPWAHDWINNTSKVYKTLAKGTALVLGLIGAYKAFSLGKGMLSKLPFIGRFFGGGSGPDGSQSKPFYVRMLDKFGLGGMFGVGSSTGGEVGSDEATQIIKNNAGGIVSVITALGSKFAWLIPLLTRLIGVVGLAVVAYEAVVIGVGYLDDWMKKKLMDTKLDEADRPLLGTPDAKHIQDIYRGKGVELSEGELAAKVKGYQSLSGTGDKSWMTKIPLVGDMFDNKGFGVPTADKMLEQGADKFVNKNRSLGLDNAGKNLVTIPRQPDTEQGSEAMIAEVMQRVDDGRKGLMQYAMRDALAGDEKIDPSEWVRIFRAGIDGAIITQEASATNKNTAEANKKKDMSTISTRRGC